MRTMGVRLPHSGLFLGADGRPTTPERARVFPTSLATRIAATFHCGEPVWIEWDAHERAHAITPFSAVTFRIDQDPEEVYTLDEMVSGNIDTPDLVDDIRAMKVGDVITGGGGAAAAYMIERLS